MSDFPTYQISKFLDDKRDYQVVIRTDDFQELLGAMKNIKPLVEAVEKKAVKPDVFEGGLPQTITCKDHKQEMRLRQGKFGPYYSHKWGDEWCNLDAKKI